MTDREESQRSRPATRRKECDLETSQSGSMENPVRGDPWDMSCYHCGQRGHIWAQCLRLRDRLSRPNPQRVDWVKTQPDEGQCCQARGLAVYHLLRRGPGQLLWGRLDARDSGFLVYRVGTGLSLRRESLVPLEVDGRKVNGYWDTGAELTLAQPEVVASDQVVPATYVTLMGVGGTPFKVPVVRVHLKWGAKEGPKDMGVHPHLPTEVLIGGGGDLEDWPSSSQGALVGTQSQSQQGAQSLTTGTVPCPRHRTLTRWGGNAQGHGSERLQPQTQPARESRSPSLSQLLSSRPSCRKIPPCRR
nr:uncharacterized protein LOC116816495 [Chelonoidis abingdonii]